MNLKCTETAKHAGYQFVEGIVYDVHKNDAEYLLATKWFEKTKDKAVVTVHELGFDPEATWADSGKKILTK